jgi:hypothetical protein
MRRPEVIADSGTGGFNSESPSQMIEAATAISNRPAVAREPTLLSCGLTNETD